MFNRLVFCVVAASFLSSADCLAKDVVISKDVVVSKANPFIVGLRTTEKSTVPLTKEFVFEHRGIKVKFKVPAEWGDITEKIDSVDWLNVSPFSYWHKVGKGCVRKPARYGDDYARAVCFVMGLNSYEDTFDARISEMKSTISARSKSPYVKQKIIFNDRVFDSLAIEAHEFSWIDLGKDGDLFLGRFIVARLLKSKAYVEFHLSVPLGAKDPPKLQKENFEFEKQLNSIIDSLEITASKK